MNPNEISKNKKYLKSIKTNTKIVKFKFLRVRVSFEHDITRLIKGVAKTKAKTTSTETLNNTRTRTDDLFLKEKEKEKNG